MCKSERKVSPTEDAMYCTAVACKLIIGTWTTLVGRGPTLDAYVSVQGGATPN